MPSHQPTMGRHRPTASSAKPQGLEYITPQTTLPAQPHRSLNTLCCGHSCQSLSCGLRSLPPHAPQRHLLKRSPNWRTNMTTFSGHTPKSRTEHGEWLLSRHTLRSVCHLVTYLAPLANIFLGNQALRPRASHQIRRPASRVDTSRLCIPPPQHPGAIMALFPHRLRCRCYGEPEPLSGYPRDIT